MVVNRKLLDAHRRGFRAYWHWRSHRRGGRRGELLMVGIEVCESTAGRYMIRTGRPRSQRWKTFLRKLCSWDRFD